MAALSYHHIQCEHYIDDPPHRMHSSIKESSKAPMTTTNKPFDEDYFREPMMIVMTTTMTMTMVVTGTTAMKMLIPTSAPTKSEKA